MNLIKFDPFLHTNQRMPSFLDDFFGRSISDFVGADFATNVPSVNISENTDGFHMELAVPGLTREDFQIAVDKDRLTISAQKTMNSEKAEKTFTRREFNYSTFARTFYLPKTVDKDRISAKYENGILMVTVPKKAEVVKEEKSRTIQIS